MGILDQLAGQYPKTKYHIHGGGSVVVTSAWQEKQLGEEWRDSPRIVEQPKKK